MAYLGIDFNNSSDIIDIRMTFSYESKNLSESGVKPRPLGRGYKPFCCFLSII